MRTPRAICVAVAVVAAAFSVALFAPSPGRAQVGGPELTPPEPEGLEVLTRGPVHEAYAQPVVFDPAPSPVISEQPPEAIEEIPPDEKPEGDNVEWIPGYWSWDEDESRFIWVSGIWRVMPPGLDWVPGYWNAVDGGYQWVSGFWRNEEVEEIAYLPQPPESLEAGAVGTAPSVNHVWVPGSWVWRTTRYAWRPGYWVLYQPGWVWVPGYYVWTPYGFVYVNGFWDYEPIHRGVMFAPVVYRTGYIPRPGFVYSPVVVIDFNVCTHHFFCRPRYRHYYFGDYYATTYIDHGIYPWFSFHMSRYGYDPLFAYSSWHFGRSDRLWSTRLRDDYVFRRDNRDARPPVTFIAMKKEIERPSQKDVSKIALATSLSALATRRDAPVKFEKIDAARKDEIRKSARLLKDAGAQRIALESKQETKRAPDGKIDASSVKKAKIPKTGISRKGRPGTGSANILKPPTLPDVPKEDASKIPKKGTTILRPRPEEALEDTARDAIKGKMKDIDKKKDASGTPKPKLRDRDDKDKLKKLIPKKADDGKKSAPINLDSKKNMKKKTGESSTAPDLKKLVDPNKAREVKKELESKKQPRKRQVDSDKKKKPVEPPKPEEDEKKEKKKKG